MLRFLASGGDKFNLGPETRFDCSELLCNKVLLNIKEIEKASDRDIRRSQKECPHPFLLGVMYLRERGIVPKLLSQYILLILILRVSDPGAPSNSWRRLWH